MFDELEQSVREITEFMVVKHGFKFLALELHSKENLLPGTTRMMFWMRFNQAKLYEMAGCWFEPDYNHMYSELDYV